jgi:glutamate:GABA antiporter
MSIITTFIPFLFLFAAMAWVQSRPAGPEVRRVPGGRPVAMALATLGFVTTLVTIILSAAPAEEEPNKPLAVAKVLLSTAALIVAGVAMFVIARYKKRALPAEAPTLPIA